MSRMEQLRQKAGIAVINIVILLYTSICFSQNKNEDSYIIINKIMSILNDSGRQKILCLSNDNSHTINVIAVQKCLHENNGDDSKCEYGFTVDKDSITNKIFNTDEYAYLLSQSKNSEWDLKSIDKRYISNGGIKDKNCVKISHPVFTKNGKFALVAVLDKSMSYIEIYKKENYKWIRQKMIVPLQIQKKVTRD